jgi:hypothetical protein
MAVSSGCALSPAIHPSQELQPTVSTDIIAVAADRPPRDHRLLTARSVWLLVACLVLALVLGTLPDFVREAGQVVQPEVRTFTQLSPAELAILAEHGISISAYVLYVLAWVHAPTVVYVAVSGIIIWRRAHDRVAFTMAILLLIIGAAMPYFSGITEFRAGWLTLVHFAQAAGFYGLLLISYVFPTGRFVPRWIGPVAILWAPVVLAWALLPNSPLAVMDAGGVLTPVGLVEVLLGLGLGVYSQAYRYRRVSSPLQRQQSKTLFFGFAATFLIYLAAVLPYFMFAALRQPGLTYLLYDLLLVPLLMRTAFIALPLSIGFAILRYRLWDIDIIIRRTLTYAVLTGALAAIYGVAVIVLQHLFILISGQRLSQLATVITTLAIAALFVPLRRRLQQGIDRRFYRRHYDAAQVLAAFGETCKYEVDAARLTDRLLAAVDEAVQPAHISLWLMNPPATDGSVESARSQ